MAIISPQPPEGRTRFNRDDNVIAAAIHVMSRRGYAATTIQAVADEVGVLKGSLYHYFRSKEDLLFRILEESYADNEAIVEDVSALGLGAFDELVEYLRRISSWYLSNVDRASIFFTEGRHLSGERLEATKEKGRKYEQYLQKLVEKAQIDGTIRIDLDARLISRFILGAVNSARSWPSRSGTQFKDEVLVNSFLELVKSSIMRRED